MKQKQVLKIYDGKTILHILHKMVKYFKHINYVQNKQLSASA